MNRRLNVQEMLENIINSTNVYFQPPETVRMKYPAIVYELENMHMLYANNKPYNHTEVYSVIYITKNPDDDNIYKISNLSTCSFIRTYKSDNLYHYVFRINY